MPTARQQVIAENVAHADTPGYRARDIADFAAIVDDRTGAFTARTDPAGAYRRSAPTRTASSAREQTALGAETPNGNTVSLEDQMMRGAEVRQEHEMALGVYAKSLEILRATRQPALREARMDEMMRTMAASASGMAAQAARLRLTSENIANADTPGYRRKTVCFEEAFAHTATSGRSRTGPVRLDQTELVKVYDPTNPLAGPDGSYEGSNVNLVRRDRRRPRGEPLATRRTCRCSTRRGRWRARCSTCCAAEED